MSRIQQRPLDMRDPATQLRVFKALANPVRASIIRYLHCGPSCVNLACIRLGVSQPNLSKHLQILEEAGLIGCHEHGAQHCYFLCRPGLMDHLFAVLDQVFDFVPCSQSEQTEEG